MRHIDKRVYIFNAYSHEIEVDCDLLNCGWDIGNNLDLACDEPLTDAQVHECLWLWDTQEEELENEELATDSV